MSHANKGALTGLIGRPGRAASISSILLTLAALSGLGCRTTPPVTNVAAVAPGAATGAEGQAPIPKPTDSTEPVTYTPFDGAAAFASLQKQCDFGVRPIGSAAHEKCLAYLLSEMRKYADQTIVQKFDYKSADGKLPNTNVIGVFNPEGSDKPSTHPILLLAHWDTRPIADGPFSAETRRGVSFRFSTGVWRPMAPIMGADDAASGVAVLLHLAKMFHEHKPKTGVILLLDDGEDYGDFQANQQTGDGVEMGARYFAEHYKENPNFGQPTYGILLDMVGAKNAIFPRESISENSAKLVNDKVYAAAARLGYGAMFPDDPTKMQSVSDDHVSIIEHGIPTIDLIHPLPFAPYEQSGYVYWHTTMDTPDKCSAKTLKAVGDVVSYVIYHEAP